MAEGIAHRAEVPTYTADIWIGGNVFDAESICRAYCDDVGFCVSVTPTSFQYMGGTTSGVRVGLINYGRLPSTPKAIFAHAETLADLLITGLGQESASIVASDRTVWLSRRKQGTES